MVSVSVPDVVFPVNVGFEKKQTSTSRSTTEAEMVGLATTLFGEGIPTLSLWELILGRSVSLDIQDNQATIKVAKKGCSSKLRHVLRTHKVNLGSVAEILKKDTVTLSYVITAEQAVDIFTKALPPIK